MLYSEDFEFSLRRIERLEHFNLKLPCERQSVVIEEFISPFIWHVVVIDINQNRLMKLYSI